MKHFLLLIILAMILLPAGFGRAEPVKLAPGAKLTFEFPDLPPTFYTQQTGDKRPAMLTAELPDNYTPEGKFPLFVFLSGANGGRGDGTWRSIVGPHDFIAVGMPLFKDKPVERPSPLPGIKYDASKLITNDDGDLLVKSYRVMLSRLLEAVPNTAPYLNAFGGFSNGAHATAATVAAKDPFIREHFSSFLLVEGGMILAFDPAPLKQPELKRARYLLLTGDQGEVEKRQLIEPFIVKSVDWAHSQQIDFTRAVMTGYGHTFPAEYKHLAGAWVRGVKLPQVGKKGE